jgi:hypothetical protein
MKLGMVGAEVGDGETKESQLRPPLLKHSSFRTLLNRAVHECAVILSAGP